MWTLPQPQPAGQEPLLEHLSLAQLQKKPGKYSGWIQHSSPQLQWNYFQDQVVPICS